MAIGAQNDEMKWKWGFRTDKVISLRMYDVGDQQDWKDFGATLYTFEITNC